MDKEQREYMAERVRKIVKEHMDKIQNDTTEALKKVPSERIRFAEALVKSKELQAQALGHLVEYLRGTVDSVFDDDQYMEFREAEKQDKDKIYTKGKERIDELQKESLLLMDRCMLTEDGEALCKLIKSFEAKSF